MSTKIGFKRFDITYRHPHKIVMRNVSVIYLEGIRQISQIYSEDVINLPRWRQWADVEMDDEPRIIPFPVNQNFDGQNVDLLN